MDCARRRYQPRHVEAGVLHGVIREHLDEFLRAAAEASSGGEGIEMPPSPSSIKRVGVRVAYVFTHDPG